MMRRKRGRLYGVLTGMAVLGLAAFFVLQAFDDSLVFFRSPSDLQDKPVAEGRNFRLGGLVEEDSVEKIAGTMVMTFRVTDGAHSVPVRFEGLVPDLFREGQGVITEGSLDDNGLFVAREVLAKHDENYMPAEVMESLKETGYWQGSAEGGESSLESDAP